MSASPVKSVPEDSTSRGVGGGGCCSTYCHNLSEKSFQKKPISIDLGQLLKTKLKRCLTTLDLTAYGVGKHKKTLYRNVYNKSMVCRRNTVEVVIRNLVVVKRNS